MDQSRNNRIQNERSNLSKPQIFVQLAFGVSWSPRHAPQTHTVTYMSRNLKSAREAGNFPRQVPPPNTNFLAVPEQRQHRSREHSGRHHQQRQQNRQHYHAHQSHASTQARDPGRSRGQTGDHSTDSSRQRPRHGSRSESRGTLHERGRSAPPPFNDSPWDVHHASASAVFPSQAEAGGDQLQSWKALPAPPSQYRLGEDGLPWSAWAWPADAQGDDDNEEEEEEEEEVMNYGNNPTAVSLSAEPLRRDDVDRARELESLSTAMMTVDNGFENQWWYQGQRESVESWWPRDTEDYEDHEDDARTITTAEAMLLAESEPPSALGPDEDQLLNLHALVSPISETSTPAQSFNRPLYRSLTTRSEELWLGR
ncbi:hypothetical protein GGR54DRAFT_633838 [Hypoxylon sp. NC1633]|nr:hypothetical protein GGR54DRAFT_633838 [Hypoxylon sp. NC1633]